MLWHRQGFPNAPWYQVMPSNAHGVLMNAPQRTERPPSSAGPVPFGKQCQKCGAQLRQERECLYLLGFGNCI